MGKNAYEAFSDGDDFDETAVNQITVQLGRVTGTGLYPFIARCADPADLSGAAVTQVILHTTRALTLYKLILLYEEASSADAGITLEIGKETDANYYYTGTSEVSKAQWYELDCTLLQTDVGAGDTVLFASAGGKVGTGAVIAVIEYGFA